MSPLAYLFSSFVVVQHLVITSAGAGRAGGEGTVLTGRAAAQTQLLRGGNFRHDSAPGVK